MRMNRGANGCKNEILLHDYFHGAKEKRLIKINLSVYKH
jgi:hypothetical protein